MGFPVIYEILGETQDERDFVFVTKRVLTNIIGLMLGGSVSLMNSLDEAEKKNFKGKVQVIYINLPCVIEFGSKTLSRVAYLRDRLVVARELLTETGSIFVQISNKNIHLVRRLLDEIFGNQNFIQPEQIKALLTHLSKTELRGSSRESLKFFSDLLDFTLCYAKRKKEDYMGHNKKIEQIFYLPTDPNGIGARLIVEGYFSKLVRTLIKKNNLPEGSIRVQVGPNDIDRVVFTIECDSEKLFWIVRDEYLDGVKRGFRQMELMVLEAL